jgi:hypothetical protein
MSSFPSGDGSANRNPTTALFSSQQRQPTTAFICVVPGCGRQLERRKSGHFLCIEHGMHIFENRIEYKLIRTKYARYAVPAYGFDDDYTDYTLGELCNVMQEHERHLAQENAKQELSSTMSIDIAEDTLSPSTTRSQHKLSSYNNTTNECHIHHVPASKDAFFNSGKSNTFSGRSVSNFAPSNACFGFQDDRHHSFLLSNLQQSTPYMTFENTNIVNAGKGPYCTNFNYTAPQPCINSYNENQVKTAGLMYAANNTTAANHVYRTPNLSRPSSSVAMDQCTQPFQMTTPHAMRTSSSDVVPLFLCFPHFSDLCIQVS